MVMKIGKKANEERDRKGINGIVLLGSMRCKKKCFCTQAVMVVDRWWRWARAEALKAKFKKQSTLSEETYDWTRHFYVCCAEQVPSFLFVFLNYKNKAILDITEHQFLTYFYRLAVMASV